jgi:hypothetical protein
LRCSTERGNCWHLPEALQRSPAWAGAIQSGAHAGRTIARRLAATSEPKSFTYHDLGTMATVSRFSAVATIAGCDCRDSSGVAARDVWDPGVFGVEDKRELDFTHLQQRWLREAAKGNLLERLATRKTRTAHRDLVWLRHLSDYLRTLQEAGEDPSGLTREDMVGFLSWLRVRVPDPKPPPPCRQRDPPRDSVRATSPRRAR